MYNIWKTPEEWNEHSAGFLTKKTNVDYVSPGEKTSTETLKRWTWHGKTSVSRHCMEMNTENGLSYMLSLD